MHTKAQIEWHHAEARRKFKGCKKCKGQYHGCECENVLRLHLRAWEACVPEGFWEFSPRRFEADPVFQNYIKTGAYELIQRKTHGLIFFGTNSLKKTNFINYIVVEAIRRGASAYYTSGVVLDSDLRFYTSFSEPERYHLRSNLDECRFLAIDGIDATVSWENGFKREFMRTVKRRYDDGLPFILGVDQPPRAFFDAFPSSISSILRAKKVESVLFPDK